MGGRSHPLRITERKFQRPVGLIWVGYDDLQWLSDCVNKIAVSNSNGNIFLHQRDGYKAIHIIRCSNRNGPFLEIFEFHSGSRQGVIRIPEGKNRQEWHEFAKLCKSFRKGPEQSNPNGGDLRRRVVAGGSTTQERGEGSKPQIMHNAINANKIASISLANAINSTDKGSFWNSSHSICDVNAHLNITMELICGPDGNWQVTHTNVTQARAPSKPRPTHTDVGPSTQVNRPNSASQQVWRPKPVPTNPSKATGNLQSKPNEPSSDPIQPRSHKSPNPTTTSVLELSLQIVLADTPSTSSAMVSEEPVGISEMES